MVKLRCTCAKDMYSEAQCPNQAVAYVTDHDGAKLYHCAKHVVMAVDKGWNKMEDFTLLPGKKLPRPLPPAIYNHDWEKKNLVMLSDRGGGGMYDLYRCNKCGETIKRYGLSDLRFSGCRIPDRTPICKGPKEPVL